LAEKENGVPVMQKASIGMQMMSILLLKKNKYKIPPDLINQFQD
jgi:hypothetical protein